MIKRHFKDPPTTAPEQWETHGAGISRAFRFIGTDYCVLRAGHPTALWPWYGLRPDGTMILNPNNGRAFQYVEDAKAFTAAEAQKARG